MIGIQLGAILFVLWMSYFSYLHFRRREFTIVEYVLWQSLWIGLLIVVLWPKSVQFILTTFSIARTFDLVVVVGIIVLFGITFRNYVILKRMEKRVEDFIRSEALKNIDTQE